MGKRELQKEKKIALLEVIKKKKATLFGNFKNVTNAEKVEAWEEVLFKAKSLELATSEKTWTYARDNLFGMWKSRTLSKRDNMRKTGTGGGSDKILDEVDLIILDILGKVSKVVDGLRLPESGDNCIILETENSESHEWKNIPASNIITLTVDANDGASGSNTNFLNETNSSKKRKNKNELVAPKKKLNIAEQEKNLKMELLQVEIYHRKLQILKLEEELGLPYSEFSKNIPKN